MSKLSEAAEEIRKTVKIKNIISIKSLVGTDTVKWKEIEKQLLEKIENLEFKAKAEESDFCGRMETFFYLLVEGIIVNDQPLAAIVRIGRTFTNQIGIIDGIPENWDPLKTTDYEETEFPIDTYQNLLIYLENELIEAKKIPSEIDELETELKETRTFKSHESPTKKLFM